MDSNIHEFGEAKKLKIHILVVSSSRTLKDDRSGKELKKHYEGHEVTISLSRENYVDLLISIVKNLDKDVIITTGGTGPSSRDITIQVVSRIAEKEIRGFGELFRIVSNKEIAYFSNSSLFIIGKTQIYCLPGSLDSVKKGSEIIDKFMYHIYHELYKE